MLVKGYAGCKGYAGWVISGSLVDIMTTVINIVRLNLA
jgi:hypothetical protein